MSSEIESPFGNFCRTCMTQDNEADTEFQSIFDTIPNTDKPISDLLNILIECNIVKGMPNMVCNKCVQRVFDVHEFQQMCLRTQTKFLLMTEEKEYTGEIVVPSESLLDAAVEQSDPLKEDENMQSDRKADPTKDQRPQSSLSNDDDFNWPSEEETCETDSKDVTTDIQTNNRTFECDICLRNFVKAKGLYDHKRNHPPLSAFVCNTCGKRYKRRAHFNKHKLEHKGGENERSPEESEGEEEKKPKQIRRKPKILTCEYCPRVFKKTFNLNNHRRTHTGEKPYLCSECGKSFRCITTLKNHQFRHTGVRRHECPLCPKKFGDISNLAAHKLVHSDAKPHVCDTCGASFKYSSSLKKHKMYHEEKSVKCEQCDMRFYTIGHMRRHMLTHTGEKPDKCKYCDRAFNQRGCLMQHMKVHLGNNVYRCDLCPMGFPTFKAMQTHYASHKNEDEATRNKNLEALAEYERSLTNK